MKHIQLENDVLSGTEQLTAAILSRGVCGQRWSSSKSTALAKRVVFPAMRRMVQCET
jgi:hypothetical protein